jgi:hypothetical protein
MSDDDKINELIREIATKHEVVIGRDDPIMILRTINDRLLQDGVANQQKLLENLKEELESISHRWSNDAKGKAERILSAALAASQEAMAKSMREGAETVAGILRFEFEAVLTTIQATKRIAIINVAAASMAILAAAMMLLRGML